MEDEIKRLRKDLEHLRDDVYADGPANGVAASLQRLADGQDQVRTDILGIKEEVRGIKNYQKDQNGAVNGIKLQMAMMEGARLERDKWEERQAASLKWVIGSSLAGAGIISGIVFGILNLFTHGSP